VTLKINLSTGYEHFVNEYKKGIGVLFSIIEIM